MIIIGIWMGLIVGLGIGASLPKEEPKLLCTKIEKGYSCVNYK